MTTRAEAIAAAGQLLADAWRERDHLAATAGVRAVAEAAHYPGHPLTVEQIQERYEEMRAGARRQAPNAA